VRIILTHEKYRRNTAGIQTWRSDLRNVQIPSQPPDHRTYSPEVTEVTLAISRFIAVARFQT